MSKLDTLIKTFNKEYNEVIATRGITTVTTKRIPFTSPRANYMLYGGLPQGRIIEFAGEESSGKTTTALDIVSNAQKLFNAEWQGEMEQVSKIEKPTKAQTTRLEYLKSRGPKQIVYIDCENTLDEEWARKLGVVVEDMIILKPLSQPAEQIFQMALEMIETDETGLMVIDSLGVMLSAQAYEKTMEDKTYGGISAPLTLFSKKAEMLCTRHNCTVIGINQMREDMNSKFGGMITTGGKAWKHNCSVRLMFQKGQFIDERGNELKRSADEPHGNIVTMSIVKTKVCKPDRRTGAYTLNYTYGVDVIADTIDVGIRYGCVIQAGSWFNFVDLETGEIISDEDGEEIKIQGRPNVVEYLKQNPTLFEELYAVVSKKIEG